MAVPNVKLEPGIYSMDNQRGMQGEDLDPDINLVDLHYNKAYERDLRLMENYKQMSILYNRDHPDFRHINRKEKAWKELSERTGMSVESCRKRVTYIRARFTVERRNIKNGQLVSDWPLMDKLRFLHRHVQVRRFRGAEETEGDGEYDEDPQNNPSSTSLYNVSMGLSNGLKRSSDDEESNMRPAKRRASTDDFDSHFAANTPYKHSMYVPIPEVKTPDIISGGGGFLKRDEHVIFGEYVAEVLRKLPQQVQPQTTLRIMKVLVEAQDAVLTQQQQQQQDADHQSKTDHVADAVSLGQQGAATD